jgi:hypothetical protein
MEHAGSTFNMRLTLMDNPETELVSYPVQYSNQDIAECISKLEDAVLGADRDLVIVSLVVFAMCLSDPDLAKDSKRFQDALDSVSNHMCWVLQSGSPTAPKIDPKMMN